MTRRVSRLIGLGGLAVHLCLLSGVVAHAQPASPYPLDDKLANEPAPWTVPGKWGARGNWGRWGEEDKRGMLNFITPELIVQAAGLVKQGKVYRARRGDAQRPAPGHHARAASACRSSRERRLRSGDAARAVRSRSAAGRGELHRSCTTTSARTSTRSRTSIARTRCTTTCRRPSRSAPCTATRRA